MYDYILVKYGDLTLKGKNQHVFRRNINNQIVFKTKHLDVDFSFQHDLVLIRLNDVNPKDVIEVLNHIAGLSSYALTKVCDFDFDKIEKCAIDLIRHEIKQPSTFKVETKRANKRIPYTSLAISRELAGRILRQVEGLTVDVHHPSQTLFVEVRKDMTFVYLTKMKGIGGFPTSIGGKALVMLSGGIDSPVAGFLGMKTGLEIECIHFESTPLTPIESVQKVIDLTQALAIYSPKSKIKLHLVPFRDIHEMLLKDVNESYLITIMRRMMYRIAEKIAKIHRNQLIISGDSIGQVASQTISSLITVQEVVSTLIVRPLATYDKNDIIKIARKIGTLEISNRPFSDCCTVYVPDAPTTKPTIQKAYQMESVLDFDSLIQTAVEQTKSIVVEADKGLSIIDKGFSLDEVFENESIRD